MNSIYLCSLEAPPPSMTSKGKGFIWPVSFWPETVKKDYISLAPCVLSSSLFETSAGRSLLPAEAWCRLARWRPWLTT